MDHPLFTIQSIPDEQNQAIYFLLNILLHCIMSHDIKFANVKYFILFVICDYDSNPFVIDLMSFSVYLTVLSLRQGGQNRLSLNSLLLSNTVCREATNPSLGLCACFNLWQLSPLSFWHFPLHPPPPSLLYSV